MKKCKTCLEIKNNNDFYNGHARCKLCYIEIVKKHRKDKIDHYKEYDKARANNPDRVMARLQYQKSDHGKIACNKAKRTYIERNIIKRSAHIILRNAVRDGRIHKKDNCESCGLSHTKIHVHHDDYSKPFDVRWLCPKCHSQWHKDNGSGLNG